MSNNVSRTAELPKSGIKSPVVASTTTNITLSGIQEIDGIMIKHHQRVLVREQTDLTQNGIYLANRNDWELAPDFTSDNLVSGVLVMDANGTDGYQIIFDGVYSEGTTEINISTVYGSTVTTTTTDVTVYDPGYPIVYLSDTSFQIDNIDATNIYKVGLRVAFELNGVVVYAVVDTVTYSGGNTIVTLTMEEVGEVIPIGVESASLVTNSDPTGWTLSNSGASFTNNINTIVSGVIGATIYWIAAGDYGEIATSIDGGVTWTMRSSGTSENILSSCYDFDNEQFLFGCKGSTIIKTVNGTSFVASTPASLTALYSLTTDGAIPSIQYSTIYGFVAAHRSSFSNGGDVVRSTDGGATWTSIFSSPEIHIYDIKFQNPISGTYFLIGTRYRTYYTNDGIAFNSRGTVTSGALSLAGRLADDNILVVTTNGVLLSGLWTSTSYLFLNTTFFPSNINKIITANFLYPFFLAVGNDGLIGYSATTNTNDSKILTLVPNPFGIRVDIYDAFYNETEKMFVAVGSRNQICRSTNGIV